MAFPTANMRIEAGPARFFTKSRHLNTPLESRGNRADHLATQAHKLAGVGAVYAGNRAGAAKAAPPGRTEQAALFTVATTIVIAIKILAFRSGRCFHRISKLPQFWACGRIVLHAGEILASAGIDTNGVAFLDKVGALNFDASLGLDFLGHACGSIATNRNLGKNDLQIHAEG